MDDLRRAGKGFLLRIKWGKSCQRADQGFWVPLLPVLGSPGCPVANLLALKRELSGFSGGVPLFFLQPGKGLMLAKGKFLTAPLVRAWLKVLLGALGEGKDSYTCHSFRRGAFSAAFAAGAAWKDLQELGGWRSSAVQLYIPSLRAGKKAATLLMGTYV